MTLRKCAICRFVIILFLPILFPLNACSVVIGEEKNIAHPAVQTQKESKPFSKANTQITIKLSEGYRVDYTDTQFAEDSGIHPVIRITEDDIYSVARAKTYGDKEVIFYLRDPYYVSAAVRTPKGVIYRLYEGSLYRGGYYDIETFDDLFGHDGFCLYYEYNGLPVRDYYYFEDDEPRLLLHCTGTVFIEDYDNDGQKEILCFDAGDPVGGLATSARYFYMYNEELYGILPENFTDAKLRLVGAIGRSDSATIYYYFDAATPDEPHLLLQCSDNPGEPMLPACMTFDVDCIQVIINEL